MQALKFKKSTIVNCCSKSGIVDYKEVIMSTCFDADIVKVKELIKLNFDKFKFQSKDEENVDHSLQEYFHIDNHNYSITIIIR